MALSTVRFTLSKNVCMQNWLSSKSKVFVAAPIQIATLKATWGEKYPYPKPWPYKEWKFSGIWDMLDFESRNRLGENSKVICIEGNIGVGKNDFAKRLAREFDLKYIPSVTDEDIFKENNQGADVRMLDEMLSESAQSYDVKKFLSDPHPERGRVGMLQTGFCQQKFLHYAEGLQHLLNTGQGIVMAKAPWSDNVFQDALRQLGWVSRGYSKYYNNIRDNAYCELLRPHVTIYLDAPVDVCMQRIKARNRPEEVNAEKNLKQLLPAIEHQYKSAWLNQQRRDHVVMEVDWSEVGEDMDLDVIAEEMEALNLECFNVDDPMFKEWYKWGEDAIAERRLQYQDRHGMRMFFERDLPWGAQEAMFTYEDLLERDKVITRHPRFKHPKGTAREFGGRPEWHFF